MMESLAIGCDALIGDDTVVDAVGTGAPITEGGDVVIVDFKVWT